MHRGTKCIVLVVLALMFLPHIDSYSSEDKDIMENTTDQLSESEQVYTSMGLDGLIDFGVFDKAYAGYAALDTKNRDILSIVDFSLPSTEKRLYVLDMKNGKVLFHSYVSHGKGSGGLYATTFSNKHNSHQSSLGFYETENTYTGKNGYSLVLNGLEEGINDQAKARAVVMHGADYCSEAVIKSSGRLGRSFGCPSIPRELTKPIINTIKNGSLLFIYADNDTYLAKSQILPLDDDHLIVSERTPQI